MYAYMHIRNRNLDKNIYKDESYEQSQSHTQISFLDILLTLMSSLDVYMQSFEWFWENWDNLRLTA